MAIHNPADYGFSSGPNSDFNIHMHIHEEVLSDGSIVHNLIVQQDQQRLVLPAVDERDAIALWDAIANAITRYTVADVVEAS